MIVGRTTRRSRAPRLFALLVPLALALGGCDSGSGTDPDDDTSIRGTWVVTQSGITAYLVITASTVTQYVGLTEGCFDHTVYEITDQDDDSYTLTGEDGQTLEVTFVREGDDLRVSDVGGSILYTATTDDPAELEECVSPDDPTISCSDLPALSLGQAVNGELSVSDATLPISGEFYDLFGLRVQTPAEVVIEANSDDFDTYLLLYSGTGEYIDENDDFNYPESTDSRLEISLDSGCFRVVVTSFSTGETGEYTLGAN